MGEKKDNNNNVSSGDMGHYKTVMATAVATTPYEGIPELACHVYVYDPGQTKKFRKTTEVNAEYAGRVTMGELYDLRCSILAPIYYVYR